MSSPTTPLASAIDPSQSATPNDPSQAPAAPIPQADPAVLQSAATGGVAQAVPAPKPTSRLQAILSAVAQVGSTALAGVPDTGRPSFVTGLGEGARSAQAFEANQQAIKFRNFDDQVRLAQLHNQDLALQNATQAQQDAHNAAELNLRKTANDMGVDYDTIANHGPSVVDHLTASTATNGSASVPPGAHVSGDGDTIYIPQDTQKTRDGQKQMYSELAPALGLPALPEGAQFVPNKNTNFLTNKMLGYGLDGNPILHQDLPGVIAAEQTQRDQLSKNGATQNQLSALDKVIAIHQASLKALDEHAQTVADATSQRKQDEQTNQIQQKAEQQRLTNAAKPQKAASSSDPKNVSGGFDALQSAVNDLANFVKSPAMLKVDPIQAAKLMGASAGSVGGSAGPVGIHLPIPAGFSGGIESGQLADANPETRKWVTLLNGAYEPASQLPRLQTYGQSSRMSPQQMQAAKDLLPHATDDQAMALERLGIFQDRIDPYIQHIPNNGAAGVRKSWRAQ
jgi:hypothetical protein